MAGRRNSDRPWWELPLIAGAFLLALVSVAVDFAGPAGPRLGSWVVLCALLVVCGGAATVLGPYVWLRRVGVAVAASAFVAAMALTAVGLVAGDDDPEIPSPERLNGTDPTKGCANGSGIVHSADILNASGAPIAKLEVRYSPACQTNWVRVNNTVEGALVEKYIAIPGGAVEQEQDRGVGWSYSMQVYAPDSTCVDVSAVISLDGSLLGDYSTQVC
ncbi:DUF2690 domain-containing protein [Cellulomonas sp. Y8]|uniref:DUF2690 domain-containing protein n=1 Tax=Cellulomonas sp. Y8 TaxID=2591145 RepID=UPI0011C96F74|nr:DUF2690 domain-containing protein [Cellulomonas sp. Y8]